MTLTTRAVRNISFAAMLAVMLLVQQVPAFAGDTCGPEYCGSLCSMQGGYLAYTECDPGSCNGSGCAIGGDNCEEVCIWCNGEEMWVCI